MINAEEFNDNLFFVFEKLLMNKELAEEFAKCKTEDELYNFCLKIKGGYTKEEWKKFSEIVYRLTIDKENDKILLDNNLEEIGGGNMANNIGKKALSGTLAALTAATVLQFGSVNVSAANSSSKPSVSISRKSSSSKWKRIIKGVLIGAGVAAVAAALGYGAHRFIKYKKEKNDTIKFFDGQFNANETGNRTHARMGDGSKRGMRNLGHSCYLNAIVQQIVSDSVSKELIIHDDASNHPGKENLFNAVRELVLYAENCRKGVEVDEKYLNSLNKKLKEAGLYGKNQEDAVECLRTTVNELYPKYRQSVLSDVCVNNVLEGHSMRDLIVYNGDTERKPTSVLIKMTEKNAEAGELIEGEFYPTPGGRIFVPINRGSWNVETSKGALNSEHISIPQNIELCGESYVFVGSVLYRGDSNSGHYWSVTSSDGKNFELFNDSVFEEIDSSRALDLSNKEATLVVYKLT